MVAQSLATTESKFHSPALIARARSLYIVKGLSLSEIATKLDVPMGTVGNWSCRNGWMAERIKRQERLERELEARAEGEDEAFLRSIASQTEELTEDSLQVAREAVGEGLAGTRELQQASQSVKNFVDIYFKARRLDRQQVDVNVRADLVFRLPTEEPKNVTPEPPASETPALPST